MSVVSDHPMTPTSERTCECHDAAPCPVATPTSEREAEIRAYIVTQGEYDSWSIRDVYLDKDAAHAALKRDEDVEEWIIAGPTPIGAARAERDAALAAASPEMVKAIGYERLIREAQEQRDAALAALRDIADALDPWVLWMGTSRQPQDWGPVVDAHAEARAALRAGGAS